MSHGLAPLFGGAKLRLLQIVDSLGKSTMKSQTLASFVLVTLTALIVSGCSPAGSTPQPTSTPAPVPETSGILAEGRLEPVRYTNLSLSLAGSVSQLSVKEGEDVQAGQVLALIQAENARTLEEAQVGAATELADANDAVRKAQNALDDFSVPAKFAGMTPPQAAAQSLVTLDAARQAFEPYKGTQRQSLKT